MPISLWITYALVAFLQVWNRVPFCNFSLEQGRKFNIFTLEQVKSLRESAAHPRSKIKGVPPPPPPPPRVFSPTLQQLLITRPQADHPMCSWLIIVDKRLLYIEINRAHRRRETLRRLRFTTKYKNYSK